jgi:hypothetical protein
MKSSIAISLGFNLRRTFTELENGCYVAEVILESGERVRRKIVLCQ